MLILRLGCPDPPRGSQQSQDSYPILSLVRSQQGGRAFTVQGPGRLEARWEACSALSPKPKGDYLFNFPHNCAAFTTVKFWNILSIQTETLFPLLVLSPPSWWPPIYFLSMCFCLFQVGGNPWDQLFTEHVFKVQPYFRMCQPCTSLYCQVTFPCMNKPHLIIHSPAGEH